MTTSVLVSIDSDTIVCGVDLHPVGPQELSIADPEAVEAIYSTKSPVTKGSYYTIFEPLVSLQSTRDKTEHNKRRKVWDQGFSIKGEHRDEP